jgi:hypothetical protein
MTIGRCPDREKFDLLLANRLAVTERDELEQHVEDCAACQPTPDALTNNATLWDLEPWHVTPRRDEWGLNQIAFMVNSIPCKLPPSP